MSETPSQREQRLERVLADYLHAVEAGTAPDRALLLKKHPDLAADLDSFFRNRDDVERMAAPIKHQLPDTLGLAGVATAGVGSTVRYFGDYELLEELARGGMGVVYRARQVSLNRPVALKMILKGELATAADVHRFRAEAEAAGNLDHPHIVPIYEVGEHEGQHYFSMKLVEGGSLAKKITELQSDPRATAQIVAIVSRAVHFAHQRGILHRDLKPANVLLNVGGQPHVTDFGLAKRVEGGSDLTKTGAVVGTPSYMAPEQASGKKDLSTAVDVYSLGAILYELLTGQPPFKGDSPLDTLLQAMERDPARPRSLNPQVSRDLETICLKCLEKDPAKRYRSAEALAEDLERWLKGEPIRARPSTALERIAKWARRRPAAAALIGVSGLAALGLLASAVFFTEQIRQERNAALAQERIAQEEKAAADVQRRLAEAEKTEANRQRRLANQREIEAKEQRARAELGEADAKRQLDMTRRTLLTNQLLRVAHTWERDPCQAKQLLLDERCCPVDLRDFAWGFYYRLSKRDRLTLASDTQLGSVAFAEGGKTLITSGESLITRWNADSGEKLGTYGLRGQQVAYTPDGKTVAWARFDAPEAKVLDVATGKESTISNKEGIRALAFTTDGAVLAIGGRDGSIRLWDVGTQKISTTLRGHSEQIWKLQFSPDGKHLASTGGKFFDEREMKLWELSTGKELATLSRQNQSVFSGDGRTLATLNKAGTVKLWDVANGKERANLEGTAPIFIVAFSADSKMLATGSSDPRTGEIKLWDVSSSKETATLKGHRGGVYSLAFAPDGKMLASGSLSPGEEAEADPSYAAIKLWSAQTAEEISTLRSHTKGMVYSVAFAPDGNSLASAVLGREAKIWDLRVSQERSLAGQVGVCSLAFTPEGKTMISGARDWTGKTWDAATGRELTGFTGRSIASAWVKSVVFPPDGKVMAFVSDWRIQAWETATGKEAASIVPSGRMVKVDSAGFTPDGKTFAFSWSVYDEDKRVDVGAGIKLYDVGTWKERTSHQGDFGLSMAFAPDGKKLATGGRDGTVTLWDVITWKEQVVLKGHPKDHVRFVEFSPDGKYLASGDTSATIKIWDTVTEKEVAALKGKVVAFAPDSQTLAILNDVSAGARLTGIVRLLDVMTGQERTRLQLRDAGNCLAFTRDGTILACGTQDGITLWLATVPRHVEPNQGVVK
jgi:WD40 repeat protein